MKLTIDEMKSLESILYQAITSGNDLVDLSIMHVEARHWGMIKKYLDEMLVEVSRGGDTIVFSSTEEVKSLLLRIRHEIAVAEHEEKRLAAQDRAAHAIWVSYICAAVSAISALFSAIAAIVGLVR